MQSDTKGLVGGTRKFIKDFGKDPVNALGLFIPKLICFISIISGIVGYILFIVNGGYASQVKNVKVNGLDGLADSLTVGTMEMMVGGIIAKVFLALILVEFMVVLITYFQSKGKGMRIVMTVDLIMLAIMTAITRVIIGITVGKFVFSEEQLHRMFGKIEDVSLDQRVILITYAVVSLAALLTFVALILSTEECRRMVGYMVLALVFANIVMPLLFLFVENIIPLIGFAVLIIVVLVMAWFVGYILEDHPEDIKWKKAELEKARRIESEHNKIAASNWADAKNGGRLFTSKEDCIKQAQESEKIVYAQNDKIIKLQEDIGRLEAEFGKQD